MTSGACGKRVIVALALCAAVAACSGSKRDLPTTGGFFNVQEIPLETYTAEQIFERGEYEIERKRPSGAVSGLC